MGDVTMRMIRKKSMLGSLRAWDDLPSYMKTDAVRPYYDALKQNKRSLVMKRIFDLTVALIALVVLAPIMLVTAVLIVRDSKGSFFFRQERITEYGKKFRIHKFRTMVVDAEVLGSQVTVSNDVRVTKVGRVLRKYRLDELPQLLDIVTGNMSFVGTRPETKKYVMKYAPEMFATLLLPAGVTSEASIRYKDENKLLKNAINADEIYMNYILPEKMKYNLKSVKEFSFISELITLFKTLIAVIR